MFMADRVNQMTLPEIIVRLIGSKQEGEFWDFKKQWYDDNSKADMLHDILCFANNLCNRDAYIIIGVDEERETGDGSMSQRCAFTVFCGLSLET